MSKEIRVLDYGFIRVVDTMGDDAAIVQAARISTGAGVKTAAADRHLIRYLMKYEHTSPFEMCEIKLHLRMPLFVARQWIRHRTASINEVSARYSVIREEYYSPELDVISEQSKNNRQGRETNPLAAALAEQVRDDLCDISRRCYTTYKELIDGNVSRELARGALNLNYYTEFYWKIDLHNLLRFLKLRMADDAQYEIRVYALEIAKIVKEWVPVTFEAFEDYTLKAVKLARAEVELLRRVLAAHSIQESDIDSVDLSPRELRELRKVLL